MIPPYIEILNIVIPQTKSFLKNCESLYCFISSSCTEILIDHVRNLSSSWESVGILSTLLFDTYSFPEVWLRFEEHLQCRRHHRIKHVIGCPVIDRDVTSSSIDLAISTSLIQSIVTAVRVQTSVLKLIFQLWNSMESGKFPKILLRNRNSRIIQRTTMRISSTSLIQHSTSTLEVRWLSRRIQWFPFHLSLLAVSEI